jgi:hypothetical protein
MRFMQSFLRCLVLFLTLSPLLAACVVEESPGTMPIRPLPPERPQFCPRIFDPVCAVRGGVRQTFPNACRADVAGFRIVRGGECRNDTSPGWGAGPTPGGPRFCTRQFDPVCASQGGRIRTFGNDCEARNAGFRIVYHGECRGGGGGPGWSGGGPAPDGQRFCTQDYRPVCASRGGSIRTFPNGCAADNAGYRIVAEGRC